MTWETITKSPRDRAVMPNLLDYEQARATFSWEETRNELDGLPNGSGVNIAHEAVDRHAEGRRRDHLAIRWLGKRGEVQEFTYGKLRDLLAFARILLGLVVAPKEIEFRDKLPRTRSGKIMRRLLKAQELGFQQGDTSTHETA